MDIGPFHPIFVHFPVVFLTLAVVLDLTQYIFYDKKPSYYAHWVFFAAAVAVIPSILTGLAAAKIQPESIYLFLHQLMATFLLILVVTQVVIRIFFLQNKHLTSNKHIIFLSLIIFLLVSLTGDIGGILSKGSSPFTVHTNQVEFNYNDADSIESRKYNPEQLNEYLVKKIDVLDVIPIFKAHRCINCHSTHFISETPDFAVQVPEEPVWLPRDESGKLVDWQNSPFYKSVVLLNRMPIDNEKNATGISWSERLTLLHWLQNNAPEEHPKTP